MNIKQITDDLVESYINDQWVNYQRALVPPQAREELLGFATATFHEAGTTTPATVYKDSDCLIASCNPLIADSCGIFNNVYMDERVHIIIMSSKGEMLSISQL